ncbi:MAG: M1 family metallopeptidase [Bacteroidetes bacterium]|nr:M1 family metallopeptidase [Bacteroidota bacterium]
MYHITGLFYYIKAYYFKLSMRFLIYCLVFFSIPFVGSSQSYFQQSVNYDIKVQLNDNKHELHAFEAISYTNNSPDELAFIYMHLWPNGYKDNTTALGKQLFENGNKEFYFASADKRGFIDSLSFKVNDIAVKYEVDKENIDVAKLLLNSPIKPGETITITTPFRVKIPDGNFSRLGHVSQQYQISQWYPKPAVYDKDGWHPMPYLDLGEFYSEFGTFDVYITAPKNYVIAATGNLMDNQELEWLNKKANETSARNTFTDAEMVFPASNKELKTLHFQQENIHDFAWFADKRYNVLKGEVALPDSTKTVTTWAYFTSKNAGAWKSNSIQYINNAVFNYSKWVGNYPYNVCNAVDGALTAGGGMEYPTITVISPTNSKELLELVIAHEVGHNWFYGILGSNERLHPWMDEGINSYYEGRYTKLYHGSGLNLPGFNIPALAKINNISLNEEYLSYAYPASLNNDQPIELTSEEYTELNYGAIVYKKTAYTFGYLAAYLGQSEFDRIMQIYFTQWKFKHPQPADIRKIFEQESGKDLSWFFDKLLATTNKIDYKIMKVYNSKESGYNVLVKNKGKINAPINLCGIKNNKLVAEVWYDGFSGIQNLGFPSLDVDYFVLDYAGKVPELNRNNNKYANKKIGKKVEPIKIQFLGGLDNPAKSQLFFVPTYGWNNYNKSMLGVALYNQTILQRKFEYFLMPMYAFGNKDLAGSFNVHYNIMSMRSFTNVQIGVEGKRYSYSQTPIDMSYTKLAPFVRAEFKNKRERNTLKHYLNYRFIYQINETYYGKYEFTPPVYGRDTVYRNFHEVSYELKNLRPINPYQAVLNYQAGDDMSKISLTANYSLTFKKKNKSFDVRLFAGAFINATNAGPYRFRTSGWRGYQDYLYDDIFLGRTEASGLLSQQFTEADGAFKVYTPLGQTRKWLTALNLKTSLPFPIIRLYADFAYVASDAVLKQQFLYNAGLVFSIYKNVFDIYLPLAMSSDIKNTITVNGWTYPETIRFSLNLKSVNPFKLIREIKI